MERERERKRERPPPPSPPDTMRKRGDGGGDGGRPSSLSLRLSHFLSAEQMGQQSDIYNAWPTIIKNSLLCSAHHSKEFFTMLGPP